MAPSRIGTGGAWTYTANSAHNDVLRPAPPTPTRFAVARRRRQPLTSVTINIAGTNDRRGCCRPTPKNLTETQCGCLTTGGTLTISDVDSAASFRGGRPARPGTYGTFRDRQPAAPGTYHRELGAQRVCGRRHLHRHVRGCERRRHLGPSVTINIAGTKRRPRWLSSDTKKNLTETNAGADDRRDADHQRPSTQARRASWRRPGTAGTYGTFAIGTGGAWTYTANSAHKRVCGRHHLHRHVSRFCERRRPPLTSVTINIAGTNDAPVVQKRDVPVSTISRGNNGQLVFDGQYFFGDSQTDCNRSGRPLWWASPSLAPTTPAANGNTWTRLKGGRTISLLHDEVLLLSATDRVRFKGDGSQDAEVSDFHGVGTDPMGSNFRRS